MNARQGLNKNISVEELHIQRNEIGKLDVEYAAHKRLGGEGGEKKEVSDDGDGEKKKKSKGKKGQGKKSKKGEERKQAPKKVGPPPLRPTPARLRERRDLREHCIMRLISDNDTLKVLDLSWNMISSSMGIQIGAALQDNHSLQMLKLGYNSLREKGAEAIGHALAVNTSLL
jgi:hypothetical protein